MTVTNVIIVGAGPAGIATAIQLKRYKIDFILFEKSQAGGLLKNANLVENYPGFPDGITGTMLVDLYKQHMKNLGVQTTEDEVKLVSWTGRRFFADTVKTRYQAQFVVVASGTMPKYLPNIEIPNEIESLVSYDIEHMIAMEGKRIAIIGAGDAAFDYALNLGKKNEIILLNRGKKVQCLSLLWERSRECQGISYRENIRVASISTDADGLPVLYCESGSGPVHIAVDRIVIAIGRIPALNYFSDELWDLVPDLIRDELLYMIGDAKNGRFRQTSIATGEGIMAAMKIYEKMKEKCA